MIRLQTIQVLERRKDGFWTAVYQVSVGCDFGVQFFGRGGKRPFKVILSDRRFKPKIKTLFEYRL